MSALLTAAPRVVAQQPAARHKAVPPPLKLLIVGVQAVEAAAPFFSPSELRGVDEAITAAYVAALRAGISSPLCGRNSATQLLSELAYHASTALKREQMQLLFQVFGAALFASDRAPGPEGATDVEQLKNLLAQESSAARIRTIVAAVRAASLIK